MKHLFCLLPLLVAVSSHVSATEMTGFATRYYDEDDSLTEISTTMPLTSTIAIGKKTVQMQVTHLADISSTPVNKDSSARWVCLHDDDGTNYWFISDNEMGAGLLTALVIAKDGIHNECAKTTEPVRVSSARKRSPKRKRCFFIRRRQYRMDSSRVIRSLITSMAKKCLA
ncbi:MAG: hypothetical protein E6314_26570 [Enterobacter sp.]|nr:hypothetical protein [Enterobacter sp.]